MNEIFLSNDGYLSLEGQKIIDDGLRALGNKVVLNEEYTLRSFFRMLEIYPLFLKLNVFLPVYMEQYSACPKKRCVIDILDYLELNKTVEMIGFPGDPGAEIYTSFIGRKSSDTVQIKTFWLENLLDLPVKLGCLKHVVFGDKVDTFEFDTIFNLFEFIEGISWELSFHNMPKECRIGLST